MKAARAVARRPCDGCTGGPRVLGRGQGGAPQTFAEACGAGRVTPTLIFPWTRNYDERFA